MANKMQLDALYREHHHRLCGWLRRRFGKNRADAEDIAQKAFTRMLELPTLEPIYNLKAFLYTVAVNLALLEVRELSCNQKFLEQEFLVFAQLTEEISPEQIYLARQRALQLVEGIELLSVKQKNILYLSRIEGKTYLQIKQQTGFSQADISRELKRSLDIIRNEDYL